MKQLALELNEKIKESKEYKEVKEKEKKMLDDEQTFKLLIKYQKLQEEYNDALRFSDYGSNVESIRKELAAVKYEVDTNPLVVEYNDSYKVLNELFNEITNIVLKEIR